MKKAKLNFFYAIILISMISINLFAQVEGRQPFPYVIQNNTPYPDSEVYVAIVGEDLSSVPGNHIWVDCKTGTVKMMDRSYNTIKGPVYVWLGPNGTGPGYDSGMPARNDIEGNRGPFNDAMYANCFTKLSDIPNKTIMLPLIQGCRVFFSFKSQLFLCFRGSSPTPGMFSGYTAPAITDYTDPNQNIEWDMIELTYDKYGYFANTSRVDSYNIPMGMESFGQDMQWDASGKLIVDAQGKAILIDSHKKVGEKKTHAQIKAAWAAYTASGSGREEFTHCINPTTGAIVAPGKIKDFADGTIGTMPNPGPYVNYYKSYIDKVWSTYSGKDLVFDSGDAGVWTGRVTGETFTFVCDKAFGTAKGYITRKPTTQEVLEGKGCLDEDVQKVAGQQLDRVVQAQICAALNRHVIPVDGEVLPKAIPTVTKNGKVAYDFSKSEFFYQAKPSNYYAAFWHQGGINMDDKAYGFCYDDVWNYASGAPSFMPSKVIVQLDGFASILDKVDAVITPANQIYAIPTPTANLDGSKSTVVTELEASKTFTWSVVSKPAGSNPTIASSTSAVTTINGLATGETIVKLVVKAGFEQDSATTSIRISNPCDVFPEGNAGSDQRVTIEKGMTTASTSLEGTATDPLLGAANRNAMTYSWSKISGNGGAIATPNLLKTAISGLTKGEYVYELTTSIASSCATPLSVKSQVKVTVDTAAIANPICSGSCTGVNGSKFNWEATNSLTNPNFTIVTTEKMSVNEFKYSVNGGGFALINAPSVNQPLIINATNGQVVRIQMVWTITPAGGGCIGDNNVANNADITFTVGDCGGSIDPLDPIVGACGGSVSGTNGSGFDWSISSDAHPVLTFIPVANKSTAPVVLHYRVNGGAEGGYNSFNGMNFTINNTQVGDVVEFYYVYTVPQGGEGNSMASWTSFSVGCTATDLKSDKFIESQIAIYPNPASTYITIDVPLEFNVSSARVINSNGTVVIDFIPSSEFSSINVEELPQGVYFIQILGEQPIVKKFIKR